MPKLDLAYLCLYFNKLMVLPSAALIKTSCITLHYFGLMNPKVMEWIFSVNTATVEVLMFIKPFPEPVSDI